LSLRKKGSCAISPPSVLRTARSASAGVRDRPYCRRSPATVTCSASFGAATVQRTAAAVERLQAIAGLGIQCQRAIERGLQRAAGEGL
jgi:hypothetical protein